MKFGGKVWKDGNFWLIEVPALDVITQGYTKKEAYFMISDAIASLVNKKGFSVNLEINKNDTFNVYSENDEQLQELYQKRGKAHSMQKVADKLRDIAYSV